MATCGYLEEWLWEGHEEVVREIEVLEGGQDGEHRWVQVHQVVGAEKEGSYVCVCLSCILNEITTAPEIEVGELLVVVNQISWKRDEASASKGEGGKVGQTVQHLLQLLLLQ